MKKAKKIISGVIISLAVIILGICIAAGNYLVSYAIGRAGNGGDRNVSLEVETAASELELKIQENKTIQYELSRQFVENTTENTAEISASDGIKLKGYYYTNPDSDLWVIAIHGYRGSHLGRYDFAQKYYEKGFNVLLPDLRACGESEGNYVGMGWLDRKDIQDWINWIISKNKNADIVVHGVSMGGATTMMLSGEETPENVKVFIEDCGYSSVWDIFASELKLRFHLPEFPILNSASLFAKMRAGYFFDEASSVKQLKKCTKPMLFIHGTADDFVPFEMLDKVYEAKPGDNKKKMIAEGAGHSDAEYVLGSTYWDTVFDFIYSYIE